jgi:8-oxo-dGTP pyrophosphatase MutT (NUDIX family)
MSEEVDKNIFEGAGFLLSYKSNVILGARIKKQGDIDPIEEVEYMGGKPEGQETPYQTAHNELIEECGGDPLDKDWENRCKVLHTFQPFSKKWIWCICLDLNDEEFKRITILDKNLDSWPIDELRMFPNRSEPVRKALQALIMASKDDVIRYLSGFFEFPASQNRMKDAKSYGTREDILFTCYRLNDNDVTYRRRLRGFNLVIFENHKNYFL